MESRNTKWQLPCWQKRDFFIKENQRIIWNLLETRGNKWTRYECISYPKVDIREISTRKNNKLLIDASIININEQGKYIEINWEKFYELHKWWNRKKWNYYYIDKSEDGCWVFHIGKITGFETLYNREYARRNWQSMRKDWSTNTWNVYIDVE